jgi:membrane protease subunit (stomatin/prohibitin family)
MAIIDVVKFDGDPNLLVWRFPSDQLSWGSQVIVNESQEAVFFKGGRALDVLGPGTHTLETANLPILRVLVNAPFGSQTPFAAEIYYVNKVSVLNLKWGTQEPIPVLDPKYNVFLPVRAFGQFGIRVADSKRFVVQLAGTLKEFTAQAVSDYFRGALITKAKDSIAQSIIKEKISLLEISASLEVLSSAIAVKLKDDFARFGVALETFYLNSINVPDDDPSVISLKKALAEKAEFQILGDQSYKTVRSFNTMEEAAKNTGTMGSMVGMGLGMGAGFGFGGPMAQAMSQNMGGNSAVMPSQTAVCPHCHSQISPTSKFCGVCGNPVVLATAHCPSCGADIPAGAQFCSACGKKLSQSLCPQCHASNSPTAKFCLSCGGALH